MTIIVKEGMEDWKHVIDKGYEKKIMIFKEKPNSINSLVQSVKIFAEGYSQETNSRVSKNVLKRATLWRPEVKILSTFCRIPVVVPLCFDF